MSEIAVIGDYDIRDRKLTDAGTGTSVASTDAVVLKDTNGNYVEIDRDSFTDAVRSALGPILTNMTQKTAASGGVVVNDSNDVGTMNLSNLASVLGGVGLLSQGGDRTQLPVISSFYGLRFTVDYVNSSGPGGAYNAGTIIALGYGFSDAHLEFYIPADCSGLYFKMTGHLGGESAWKKVATTT